MRPIPGTATGIVASVGRTCCTVPVLDEVVRAGALCFRIALGLHDRDSVADCLAVRAAAQNTGAPVDILLDLPATRPRIGAGEARLFQPGECVVFRDGVVAAPSEVPVLGLSAVLHSVRPGHRMVLRDGRQQFVVEAVGETRIQARCTSCTEPLRPANACSFPDSASTFAPLRAEDRRVLAAMAAAGVTPEWVALSLVTAPDHVRSVRPVLGHVWPGGGVRVMAKIETTEALACLAGILDEADGVLLGRGDLGVSMPPEHLPRAQAAVARAAAHTGKPLAVATQILERYAATGEPYRAELSDVAMAVRQGAAAVVLCQETNDSPRPAACVDLVRRIILAETEREDPGG